MLDILKNAKFLVFPLDTMRGDHETVADEELAGCVRKDFPDNEVEVLEPCPGDTYRGWRLNEHHFTTAYHVSHVVPALCRMLGFVFNPACFEYVEASDGGYDVSSYFPKGKNYRIDCPTLGFSAESGDLRYREGYPAVPCTDTGYHRLCAFAHCVSVIDNLSEAGGKKLLVACNSQMVPSISVLANYYSEVFVMDNRYRKPVRKMYEERVFDDVLVQLWRNARSPAGAVLASCINENFMT